MVPFQDGPVRRDAVQVLDGRLGGGGQSAAGGAGTGPFKITKVVPGQYAEMTRNEAYWDKDRIPKLEKMIVYPMPEATTRVAALRAFTDATVLLASGVSLVISAWSRAACSTRTRPMFCVTCRRSPST